MKATPRLRMFAGPNGSGKSTIKAVVESAIGPDLFGVYVNPDEIEELIRRSSVLDLTGYRVDTSAKEILGFFRQSPFLAEKGLADKAVALSFENGTLSFAEVEVDSYLASVAADFIRQKLLDAGLTFTFETVMSSRDKVEFLRKAQDKGFRTYLYYVATEDPDINISRVESRVAEGGHPVSRDKIISRYYRSLELLLEAVQYSNRAYIFDNSSFDRSSTGRVWIAEVTDASVFEFKSDAMPYWFKTALWDKLATSDNEGASSV